MAQLEHNALALEFYFINFFLLFQSTHGTQKVDNFSLTWRQLDNNWEALPLPKRSHRIIIAPISFATYRVVGLREFSDKK